jgi:hypothetical protein
MPWLDIIGWFGSALLIYSVMQARILRFRVLNLAASALLAGFNAALEIWPMVAMNVALCAINLWHIRGLLTTRHDEETYEVLEVRPKDEYLRHVLRVHAADILKYQPDFLWQAEAGPNGVKAADVVSANKSASPQPHAADGRIAFLIQRGDETVGVVLVHDAGDGVAQVVLDYVTPRFRDFSPGEFVWRRSSALRDRGFRSVITSPTMVGAYYEKLGFSARPDGSFELDIAQGS